MHSELKVDASSGASYSLVRHKDLVTVDDLCERCAFVLSPTLNGFWRFYKDDKIITTTLVVDNGLLSVASWHLGSAVRLSLSI